MLCKKIFGTLFLASLAVFVIPVGGAETAENANSPQRSAGEPRSRDDGRPIEEERRAVQREDRRQEGTEEGMPAVRPDFHPDRDRFRPRWWLGVYAYNTTTGVVITHVVPRSPAHFVGLEPRDVIVTVDGYQVGYVNDRIYYLGEELQRQAGRDGRVTLLVQNWRNGRLLNVDVRLRRASRHPTRDLPAARERSDTTLDAPPPADVPPPADDQP